jgi:hypothetical protein
VAKPWQPSFDRTVPTRYPLEDGRRLSSGSGVGRSDGCSKLGTRYRAIDLCLVHVPGCAQCEMSGSGGRQWTVSVSPGVCAVVSPRESIAGLYAEVLAPAIEAAGYSPRLAAQGSDPIQMKTLLAAIQQADVALIDMRGGEWFSYYATGVCSAVGVPAVLLTEDRLDLADGLSAYLSVPVTQAPDDVAWATKLSPLISDALSHIAAEEADPIIGMRQAKGERSASSRQPRPKGGSDYSLDEAENLVVSFLRDGLSENAIRRLLIDGGFPPSWVDFRLRRRAGW